MRTAKDFRRARFHTVVVHTLRIVLPVICGVLALAFVAYVLIARSPLAQLSINSAAFDGSKLVMRSPKMSGLDAKNRPFEMMAQRAIQNFQQQDIVELEGIVAKLPVKDDVFADVFAPAGTYHTKQEKLILRDDIQVRGMDGADIDMSGATIDLKTGELLTEKPVEVRARDGQINADRMSVFDNGKRIVFEGRVRSLFRQSSSSSQSGSSQ